MNVIGPRKPKDAVDEVMKLKTEAAEVEKPEVSIVFWRNGFTVGDGDLRSYDTPEGAAFMAAIMGKRLPPEFKRDTSVSIDDKRGEDYVAPAYRAFSGSGGALGSAAPPPAAAVVRSSGSGAAALKVDEASPKTSVQVKLANGKKEVVELNLSHTVKDLMERVAAFGATGGKPFVLKAGFPPKPLGDSSATIEAAGLKNSSVTQALC
jgi:UBX domain-containing protein 1